MYQRIINDLRFRKKVSTDKIANYLGISRNLYNMYERETEIFPIKYLIKICEYFDVSLDFIFEFVKEKNYKNNKHVIDRKVSGNRLRKMRLSLNLNQEHIADILGISRPNISKYETGTATISTFNLYMLCKKFNISADYLLGKTDEPKTINVKEKDVKWKIKDTVYIYRDLLKYLREKNNLTKKDLADILGIHVKGYSQCEYEHNLFPLKHINTICNYFDISIDYFLGLSDKEKYNDYKKDIDLRVQGNNLKSLRKKNGLTLEKLSKKLGSKIGTISNYEKGRILISTKVLYKICKKYNVSADWLLGKINNPESLNQK